MKKLLFFALLLFALPAKAQQQFEKTCPVTPVGTAGYSVPIAPLTFFDPATKLYRANGCADPTNGNVLLQPDSGGGTGTVTTTGSPISGEIAAFSGSASITNAIASQITALFTGCSGTQYLGADGSCHAPVPAGTAGSEVVGSYPTSLTINRNITLSSAAPLDFINAGNFTNTTTYSAIFDTEPSTSNSCPVQTIFGGGHETAALTACAVTPTSGVANGATDGLMALVEVNDPTQGGQFSKVYGVPVFTSCLANANNTVCEGTVSDAVSSTGLNGVQLFGSEISVTPRNTSDNAYGVFINTNSATVQPSGDFDAIRVLADSTAKWNLGLNFRDGSLSSPYTAINLGKIITGTGGINSDAINFNASDQNGAISGGLSLFQGHTFQFVGYPIANFPATGEAAAYEVGLSTTNALTQWMLVKIDTSTADSITVCTTTDVSCIGFITINVNSGFNECRASSTNCPVAMTPGNFVRGILGTGTCSIGNYVLIDTTTNGRVRCQTGPPSGTMLIGIALSSQSTVGQVFDILTQFEPPSNLRGTSAAIGGSALLAGQCSQGTATVTGATTGMVANASPSSDPDSTLSTGIAIYSFVSATNTVTIRVCAIVAVTPASTTYNVSVTP